MVAKKNANLLEVGSLRLFIESISQEKNLDRSEVIAALELGVLTAIKRDFVDGANISVHISENPFEMVGKRAYKIVDHVSDYETEITLNKITTETVEGGYAYEFIPIEINRQKINIIRQVALQTLRGKSRIANIEQHFINREKKLISGIIKLINRKNIMVEAMGIEFNIPQIQTSNKNAIHHKVNERIDFILEKDEKGHYVATRSSAEYLNEVLKDVIPEIRNGLISIHKTARVAGFRSKIIIKSHDGLSDGIKYCIGRKGSTINEIIERIDGEPIDFITFKSSDIEQVVEAIKPVIVDTVYEDEDSNTIFLFVSNDQEQLARAIGFKGKNEALISQLVEKNLKIFPLDDLDKILHNDDSQYNYSLSLLTYGLGCDGELAEFLIDNGFDSIEKIAYVPEGEFDDLDLSQEVFDELRQTSKDIINDSVKFESIKNVSSLFNVGLTYDEILTLSSNEVSTLQDVADLSTFELIDILPEIQEEKAAKVIMAARN